MKYADLIKGAHYTKVAYLTEVLNAVVMEARDCANPIKAVDSISNNWRLTAVEQVAIIDEAKRVLAL
jgi:hypothetical protein